jgi:hypothetical protein
MHRFVAAPAVPAVPQGSLPGKVLMVTRSLADRLRWAVFQHFEGILVVLLVASLLTIHWWVDYKLAFLSFYYLPIIVAGFLLGRKGAVGAAVFIVNLVLFFQVVQGLQGPPGFDLAVALTLVPWAGFLILTAYVVGVLAEHREASLQDAKESYVTMLELLTFSLEAGERESRGHSHRVADLAAGLARALGLHPPEVEDIRVAALLHEVGPQHPRMLSLIAQFPGEIKRLPVARALRGANRILAEYARYYELVGEDWPVDQLPISIGTKILAVADGYFTLQLPSPVRPALSSSAALAAVERDAGRLFASEVVHALRGVVAAAEAVPGLAAERFRAGRN